ncbi:MAG TPA: sugar phosphate isomerase/epimerase [Planctomycetaceae bacterium]|nr:sugar phosphate isomerase/epimerase [Planctomycetaceae bacterium]
MARLKIGLRLASLRLPVRKGLQRAVSLGVSGVQVDPTGELAPDRLSATGRRELRRLLEHLGLELTGLTFPARRGFDTEEGLEGRLEKLTQLFALAYELRAPLVIGSIGRVPEEREHPARKLLEEVVAEIGRRADRFGTVFAVETGTESGKTLRGLLDTIALPTVRCNLDPANLLVRGYDPIAAVQELAEMIVHTHARDALREAAGDIGREVPLGEGDLNRDAYLQALAEVDYYGWFTIERQYAADPEAEVARAVAFLRRYG